MNEWVNDIPGPSVSHTSAPPPGMALITPPERVPCLHLTASSPPSKEHLGCSSCPKSLAQQMRSRPSENQSPPSLDLSSLAISTPAAPVPTLGPGQATSFPAVDMHVCTLICLSASAYPSSSPGRAFPLHEGPVKWRLPGTRAWAWARRPLPAPSSPSTGHCP